MPTQRISTVRASNQSDHLEIIMADGIVCQSGIYAITNTVTGKKYIGSAVNLRIRFRQHEAALNKGSHHSVKLQASWNKHGSQSFEMSAIEYVDDRNQLIAREQVWIDKFQSASGAGYNMRPTAESWLGVKQTPEHIAKRCSFHIGVKRSDETKEKIRQKAAGRKQSAESVEKRVSKIRGRKHTAEHIEKASIARIGRKNTPESIAKMRAVVKSPEARANMSAAALGKKLSPESIAKREATKKANRLAARLSQL